MADTSKRFNWQVSFGITHQLEYRELMQLYHNLPKMQQGVMGRKLMQAGLRALKKDGDPIVLNMLAQQEKPAVLIEQRQKEGGERAINKNVLKLLES